ncbi:CRISPR/Cas system CSM-associated protein Csm3, group 7 of RAMP superfamily [Nitrosomonas cryotolerans]|uniref:CRISPR/Cas system CSM-associated protein Csm3, group 7 of RAMP superfamily n=1 Tax=Nitrosomonas cryotolerans ATCC 49181 TaxID=1131553 RepID=A0A1N6JY66_9PROT|nr:RAMP superfamily CRISPR-associated protein [Nitrosomonas cryotolerans]SFQ07452.1 CRISPR/Cas system CSM-associated protein Csm3, group 7 of RAMP superfamily [Nitrosomonas cryotolerans]SIO49284.1 CRISPR/Cas system CSM-associated protein Csm3, group 7 of RAMP superfamily [Nitrosomonas cryotolerans ATCC 49181]
MNNSMLYCTLFVGTLVQESFLSVGGNDDPLTIVDSPFCRDGLGRPTLRGTGLAGALIAILRRLDGKVSDTISGSNKGHCSSVWRFFNSHPSSAVKYAFRQHNAIHAQTGAAADNALFNVETLPPGTCWHFILEVDTARDPEAAERARKALAHWATGRCLIGREVARGLGWMRLENLFEYPLTLDHIDHWPCAEKSQNYKAYITEQFQDIATKVEPTKNSLPGWQEITGRVIVGERDNGYGIDSLSIGGHASEELAAAWNNDFLAPDAMDTSKAKDGFDPDFSIVTIEQQDGTRLPYIPGSGLRGPLRHALARLLKARGESETLVETLFGTTECSAKLLICDVLPDEKSPLRLAWLQHHAEDEFAGGTFKSSKFDRVAVMQASFIWKMVLEDASSVEKKALEELFDLMHDGQIGIGGSQWRGHGWLRWEIDGQEIGMEETA